jgi:hypothetical protein
MDIEGAFTAISPEDCRRSGNGAGFFLEQYGGLLGGHLSYSFRNPAGEMKAC